MAEARESKGVDWENALFVGVLIFNFLDELEEAFEFVDSIGGEETNTAGGYGDERFAVLRRTNARLLGRDEGVKDATGREHQPGVGGEGLNPSGGDSGGLTVVFLSELVFTAEIVGLGKEEEEEGVLVIGREGVVAGGDRGLGVSRVKKRFVDGGRCCCGMGVGIAAVGELGESALGVIGAIEVNQGECFVDKEVGVEFLFPVDHVEDVGVTAGLEEASDPVVAGLDVGIVASRAFLQAVGFGEEPEVIELSN